MNTYLIQIGPVPAPLDNGKRHSGIDGPNESTYKTVQADSEEKAFRQVFGGAFAWPIIPGQHYQKIQIEKI